MTWTQTTLTIKDAAGASQAVIAYTDGTNYSFAHPLLDNTGAIISPATSGNQTTANGSLATIATQTNGVATAAAQATGNASLASVATNTGDLDTNLGAKADSAASSDTGTFSLIALFKRLLSTSTAISTAVQAATPAGTNIIGKFTTDQTTHGTTDLVAADITKVAGSAIAQGHGVAASAIRVELPTDGTGVVGLTAGTNIIGAVTNGGQVVTGSTITRPANTTAYVVGYLIANSTTAGSVTYPTIAAARGTDLVSVATRCILKKTGTSLSNAIFRVHFWNAQPTVSNGDGAAWLTGSANYLGYFDVTSTQVFTDAAIGIGGPGSGSAMTFKPATGTSNLYFLIEARAAYTPISGEVFTVSLEVN